MVEIDDPEGPCSLLVPNPPVSSSNSGIHFNQDSLAVLVVCDAQAELAVMTSSRILQYEFYGAEDDFGLNSRFILHDGVLMYLPSAVLADNEDLGLLHIVQRAQFDAETSFVAFERPCDFLWTAMSLVLAVG